MHKQDVLTASRTGLWHRDNTSGMTSLDAIAAELLGLPAEPTTLRQSDIRACFHVEDYLTLQDAAALAYAETGLVEAALRVVTENGAVLRTVRVRVRVRPVEDRDDAPEDAGGEAEGKAPEEAEDHEAAGRRSTGCLMGTVTDVREQASAAYPSSADEQRAREAFLLDAGRALTEARSTAEVLRVAASLSMPGFSPHGQALFGVDGDRLLLIGHHGQDDDDIEPMFPMPLSHRYPATETVRTGRPIYLRSAEEYRRRYPEMWSVVRELGRKSWAYLPLTVAGRTIGAWLAAFASEVSFTPEERSVLTTIARMLGQALSRAFLFDIERELSADLQNALLPTLAPAVPGAQVAARYVPGGGLRVGGDWYDVIPLPSHRVALVIGDVQGHDVRAAAVMAQLRIALRAYASEGHHPDGVLSRASRFLAGLSDPATVEDRFATCLYMEADTRTGTLDIARAGHHEPAIVLYDGTTVVGETAGGPPLGVEPERNYPTTRLMLEQNETLLLCTDGLIEGGGHDLDTGWERLREALAKDSDAGLERMADNLLDTVRGAEADQREGRFSSRRDDDIALLLLRRISTGREEPAADRVRRTVVLVAQSEAARVAEARRQLAALLHDWTNPDQAEGAVLMLSEVLTNVLLHTDSDAMVTGELRGRRGERQLRVEVSDSSDELPYPREPGELASSGRGLLLMETLSDSWGAEPQGEGKKTWFELHEEPAEAEDDDDSGEDGEGDDESGGGDDESGDGEGR